MPSRVQSIVMSKSRFKTAAQARAWIREKTDGMKTSKVDETEGSFRFRQFDPDACKGRFRSQNVTAGVTFVLCIE